MEGRLALPARFDSPLPVRLGFLLLVFELGTALLLALLQFGFVLLPLPLLFSVTLGRFLFRFFRFRCSDYWRGMFLFLLCSSRRG